jgi:hypothetical protein
VLRVSVEVPSTVEMLPRQAISWRLLLTPTMT